ncbi:MAG: hypothetical protein HKN74_11545 [Acidimicrobiia bacterium]|nr:hypothetical protein [Acidimicrobiia bacterium]NNF10910.1 hypothetical protein [Acidimicrobiia bacterium]NNL71637.1 hypothetical protein [Acidimicrobiia bacterium]
MDISVVFTEVEAALHRQLELVADDTDVTEAAAALMAVLEPALRQAGTTLAEQAAIEVGAQLPDYRVTVVMSDGEPQLRLAARETDVEIIAGGNEARLTLRLPEGLKSLLEQAADDAGDSVNSYVINALASRSKGSSQGNRVRTSIDL